MCPSPTRTDRLADLYRRKAEAELSHADLLLPAVQVGWSGEPDAGVALVKGMPGEADLREGRALAGADGEAANKALAALGRGAPVFATMSRPVLADRAALVSRLMLQLEAVDPCVVVALDMDAAEDVAEALGCSPSRPGVPVEVRGRIVLALDGLEASLGDEVSKRRVWRQFQGLRVGDAG